MHVKQSWSIHFCLSWPNSLRNQVFGDKMSESTQQSPAIRLQLESEKPSIHYNDSSITTLNSGFFWVHAQWKYGLPAVTLVQWGPQSFKILSKLQCLVVVWWRQFPEGKSARFPGRKERPSRFRIWEDRWTPEVSGCGERRWDWLLSFLRGWAWWKERLRRNFLSWGLTKKLVNTFASIPSASYVAKDTFLARAKLCKRSTYVEECKFVHKGSMRCQSQSSPTVANYLESVSCLWSLEGRNEVRRHSFQILVGAKTECITSVHSKNFPWISSFLILDNCSSVSTSETRFSILFREDAWRLLQTDLDCNWLEAGGFASTTVAAQACSKAGGNFFVQVLCRWTCASYSFLHRDQRSSWGGPCEHSAFVSKR